MTLKHIKELKSIEEVLQHDSDLRKYSTYILSKKDKGNEAADDIVQKLYLKLLYIFENENKIITGAYLAVSIHNLITDYYKSKYNMNTTHLCDNNKTSVDSFEIDNYDIEHYDKVNKLVECIDGLNDYERFIIRQSFTMSLKELSLVTRVDYQKLREMYRKIKIKLKKKLL